MPTKMVKISLTDKINILTNLVRNVSVGCIVTLCKDKMTVEKGSEFIDELMRDMKKQFDENLKRWKKEDMKKNVIVVVRIIR